MLYERETETRNQQLPMQQHKYKTYRLHNKVALITAGTLG